MLSTIHAITVSKSNAADLARYKFKKSKIHIIPEATLIDPVGTTSAHKAAQPTVLIHCAVRDMKRTLDAFRPFELAKNHIPKLNFKIYVFKPVMGRHMYMYLIGCIMYDLFCNCRIVFL